MKRLFGLAFAVVAIAMAGCKSTNAVPASPRSHAKQIVAATLTRSISGVSTELGSNWDIAIR